MCNEYKNLTQILQMVTSISLFVFANSRIYFLKTKELYLFASMNE
jgi:hypothetical protein